MEILSDRELAEETLRVLRSLDATLAAMMGAWSAGGMRGLRSAARNFTDRPDPDGSRARFLRDGLAGLECHDAH